MSENGQARLSRVYGTAQSLVFAAWGAGVWFDHSQRLFPLTSPVVVAANIACWGGVLLILVAIYTLRRVIQIEPAPREGGELVTAGVYRWLRHPIYTGTLIAALGLFLWKPSLGVAIVSGVLVVYLLIKVRFEEQLLAQRYAGYKDYKTRSLGFVPLWRG
jgi:protein-S-isoprenylcysteine O-methyltransferase Ste14